MRAMLIGCVGAVGMMCVISGCCTPRSGCNTKPDPTAKYQVQPGEYQRAMRERAAAKATQEAATRPTATQPAALQVLVLSGGGSNGAYGAGFLSGWSKTGQRPKFDV